MHGCASRATAAVVMLMAMPERPVGDAESGSWELAINQARPVVVSPAGAA